MAVLAQAIVRPLPWSLQDDGQGSPTGVWTGSVTVVMDGSSGSAVGEIVFSLQANGALGILYHLGEVFVAVSGNAADQEGVLKSGAMGYGPNQFDLNAFLELVGQTGSTEGLLRPADLRGLRNILLGMPLGTDDAVLQVTVANVNGDVLLVTAKGYYWDQARMAQVGAPRLPAGALWQ